MSPRSSALTCVIYTHALEAQGLLLHPLHGAREAGAEPNHQASRRDLLEGCDGRSLSHRVAIARDQHGGAKFDAVRLFGDAGESDPYVVTEGGDLGAPDRPKAKVFCKTRILSGSRTGREAVRSARGAPGKVSPRRA